MVCISSTVAPVITSFTINTPEESQECVLMQGESLRLTCESEGFPITSSIAIKHSDGQEFCPSVNSSANLTLVGTKYYGQLHHTCDVQDLRPGEQEFICRVNFLPWGDSLLESEAVEKAIQCKVMPGKKMHCVYIVLQLWVRNLFFKFYITNTVSSPTNDAPSSPTSDTPSSPTSDTPSPTPSKCMILSPSSDVELLQLFYHTIR